jgi:hypothetical protein
VSAKRNSEVLLDVSNAICRTRRRIVEMWDELEQNADLAWSFMTVMVGLEKIERDLLGLIEAEQCADAQEAVPS